MEEGKEPRTGAAVKTEEDPVDAAATGVMRANVAAIGHLEEAVLGATWTEGIVLRYGWFYGPGTSMAPGQESYELIRRRKVPLVGDGGGVWSFIHIADAADATVAAVERGSRGIYNVVDDDPAAVAEWLPALAEQLGAKKPISGRAEAEDPPYDHRRASAHEGLPHTEGRPEGLRYGRWRAGGVSCPRRRAYQQYE